MRGVKANRKWDRGWSDGQQAGTETETEEMTGSTGSAQAIGGFTQRMPMTFDQFGLCTQVLDGIRSMGYKQPTPIQARAIPLILQGRDVLAMACTGSGKTAGICSPCLFHTLCRRSAHHILLYVVGRCTKGVVKLTYE